MFLFVIVIHWGHKFLAIVKDCGMEGITTHKIRHTFVTLLLDARADIGVVSELLGQSDISITKKFYADAMPRIKKATIEKFTLQKS